MKISSLNYVVEPGKQLSIDFIENWLKENQPENEERSIQYAVFPAYDCDESISPCMLMFTATADNMDILVGDNRYIKKDNVDIWPNIWYHNFDENEVAKANFAFFGQGRMEITDVNVPVILIPAYNWDNQKKEYKADEG